MRIEHIALWVDNLEKMRSFYADYFNAASGDKYVNPKKGYSSYFLTFPGSDTRIELMNRVDITHEPHKRGFMKGIAHVAFSVGSKELVDSLTERLRNDNVIIESEPRTTGDGYYESVVLDPEGNYVEISV
jgi:lactoylglutathione lyase